MSFRSAAARVPERVRVGENPRPLVTDDGHVVVEMPLSERPSDLWLEYLLRRTRPVRLPNNVGWVNYRTSEKGEPTVSFLLRTADPDHLNEACQEIERLIEATSDDWQNDDTVIETVDHQRRINDLQARLDQTAATYSRP